MSATSWQDRHAIDIDACGSETICDESERSERAESLAAVFKSRAAPDSAAAESPWRLAVFCEYYDIDTGKWQPLNQWRAADDGSFAPQIDTSNDELFFGGNDFAVTVLAPALCAKLFSKQTLTAGDEPPLDFFSQMQFFPTQLNDHGDMVAHPAVRCVSASKWQPLGYDYGMPENVSSEIVLFLSQQFVESVYHCCSDVATCTLADLKEAGYEREFRDQFRAFAKTMKRARHEAERRYAQSTHCTGFLDRARIRLVYWLYWPTKSFFRPACAAMESNKAVADALQRLDTPLPPILSDAHSCDWRSFVAYDEENGYEVVLPNPLYKFNADDDDDATEQDVATQDGRDLESSYENGDVDDCEGSYDDLTYDDDLPDLLSLSEQDEAVDKPHLLSHPAPVVDLCENQPLRREFLLRAQRLADALDHLTNCVDDNAVCASRLNADKQSSVFDDIFRHEELTGEAADGASDYENNPQIGAISDIAVNKTEQNDNSSDSDAGSYESITELSPNTSSRSEDESSSSDDESSISDDESSSSSDDESSSSSGSDDESSSSDDESSSSESSSDDESSSTTDDESGDDESTSEERTEGSSSESADATIVVHSLADEYEFLCDDESSSAYEPFPEHNQQFSDRCPSATMRLAEHTSDVVIEIPGEYCCATSSDETVVADSVPDAPQTFDSMSLSLFDDWHRLHAIDRGFTMLVVGELDHQRAQFAEWLADSARSLTDIDGNPIAFEQCLRLVRDIERFDLHAAGKPCVRVSDTRSATSTLARFLRQETDAIVMIDIEQDVGQLLPLFGSPIDFCALTPSANYADVRAALEHLIRRLNLDPTAAQRLLADWDVRCGSAARLCEVTDHDAVLVPLAERMVDAGFVEALILRNVF